jgi:hypothetical protein
VWCSGVAHQDSATPQTRQHKETGSLQTKLRKEGEQVAAATTEEEEPRIP